MARTAPHARMSPWLPPSGGRNRTPDHLFSTNAASELPAATTTYCRPSSSYVIGPLLTGPGRRDAHKKSPVVALRAVNPADPPVKSTLPAVLRIPVRPPLSQRWLQRILPVL